MRFITEGNVLLGRLFHAVPSAVPLPVQTPQLPAAPPTVAASATFTPPAPIRAENFQLQMEAAMRSPIPVPPGFVPMGTGVMSDTFIQAPLTEASLPGWDEAVNVLNSGDLTQILILMKSVSPVMAALLMNHVLPLPGFNKADMLRRLILEASHDILQTDPEDEPPDEDAEE